MDKQQEDLTERIEQIKEHIELGKRLEEIIETPEILRGLNIAVSSLRSMCDCYETELRMDASAAEHRKNMDKRREDFVREFAVSYGGEEKARARFDAPFKNPRRYVCINVAIGVLYWLCAKITTPFSKSESRLFLEISNHHFEASKSLYRIAEVNNKEAKLKDEILRAIHDAEFREAELADVLKNYGLSEKIIEIALKKPEFLYCASIQSLKDKYAPWL